MPHNAPPTVSPIGAGEFDVRENLVDGDTCVVSIRGELDLAGAPQLKARLAALGGGAGHRAIVLDLSELSYLDSTGLAVLIAFRRRLGAGQRLALASPSAQVTRLLGLTGLNSGFDTFATVPDALLYLQQTGGLSDELPLSPDAALVVGLASTALPFASCYAAEARCWQRILLPSGDADTALPAGDPPRAEGDGHTERLARVLAHAARLARERDADAIRTGDVLRGVTSVYGDLLEP